MSNDDPVLRRPGSSVPNSYVRTHDHLTPLQWTRMCTRCGFTGSMGAGWKLGRARIWICADRAACTDRKEARHATA